MRLSLTGCARCLTSFENTKFNQKEIANGASKNVDFNTLSLL